MNDMSATVVPLGGGTTGFGHGHHREPCHDEHDTTRLRDDGGDGLDNASDRNCPTIATGPGHRLFGEVSAL